MSGNRNHKIYSGKSVRGLKAVLCAALTMVLCMSAFPSNSAVYATEPDSEPVEYTTEDAAGETEEGLNSENATEEIQEETGPVDESQADLEDVTETFEDDVLSDEPEEETEEVPEEEAQTFSVGNITYTEEDFCLQIYDSSLEEIADYSIDPADRTDTYGPDGEILSYAVVPEENQYDWIEDALTYTDSDGSVYHLIPVSYFTKNLEGDGYEFDEAEDTPFYYDSGAAATEAVNSDEEDFDVREETTEGTYYSITVDGETDWYLQVQDFTGQEPAGAAVYYVDTLDYTGDGSGRVVINLGNGNGKFNFADYTGSRQEGTLLRYTTEVLDKYADEDGSLTIHLPSETELETTFTVVDAVEEDSLEAVTIDLGRELAYDYTLVGWVNIATGEYYDVSGGSVTADIDLDDENVFYADWIAASYDHGSSGDSNLRTDTVSTEEFVTIHMFDYNDLFNMYSESVEQKVEGDETTDPTIIEAWTDSGDLYDSLLGKNGSKVTNSFLFVNNGTTRYSDQTGSQESTTGGMLSWPNYKTNGNTYTGAGNSPRNAQTEWGIVSPDSPPLNMLFDTGASSVGVHYVGEADYLFWIDEDGYYVYNSDQAAAAYNQTDQRFYVYDGTQSVSNTSFPCFLPYNTYGSTLSALNGTVNYWFGMDMDVSFYLPSAPGSGTADRPVNQVDDKDMVFNFSGDDDILIFVDDELVLDMSGIHDEAFGSINFSQGTITMGMSVDSDGNILDGTETEFTMSSGNHDLEVYYMERGGYASNLEIQFNIAPMWNYETGEVQTVTAEKVWQDVAGNILDPDKLGDYAESVEVGLFDALQEATDDAFGYIKDGTTYTVTYTDDEEVTHTYIYDSSGPTLTYIEGDIEGTDEQTDSAGRVLDKDGYVVAWLDGETLHIRIDVETLSSENNWFYAWELLDPTGAYEVLELSESDYYTTETKRENLTSYEYWSVIGDKEIEQNLGDSDFAIILTDAAQQTSETIGDTKEAFGWVIVATTEGITTQKVAFSQIATLTEVENEQNGTKSYYGTYGVTSQTEIDRLGSGALWYPVDADHSDDDASGGTVEGFYLYCVLDGTNYYLTVATDASGNNILTVTSDESEKCEFYYDSLGELRVVHEGADRVYFSADGQVGLDIAEFEADANDSRVYTLAATESSGLEATITNTIQLKDITVIKVWNDDGNRDGLEPDSVQVQLIANDENVGEAVTLNDDDKWTYTWEDLPIYENGEEIVYTVEEVSVPGGYTASYTSETDDDGNVTFTMVNTHVDAKTKITVNKVWQDADNENKSRPDSVTVQLLANGEDCEDAVTLNDGNNWSYTWDDLFAFEEGELIQYTVEEVTVDGYDTTIGNLVPIYDDDNNVTGFGITITNTRTGETEISGTKTWDDNANQDGVRPAEITVNLLCNGEQIDSITVTGDADAESWNWSFSGLPMYDSQGVAYTYTVTENVVEDYTTEISGYDIINRHNPGKVSLNVHKEWTDSDDQKGMRPASITVKLLKNGTETGDKLVLDEANGWEGTFADLDEYTNGTKNEYSVAEATVDGYDSEIIEQEGTSTIVINNKVRSDLSITKEVSGSTDTDSYEFEIVLTDPDGDPFEGDVAVTYSDGQEGTLTFTDGKAALSIGAGETATLKDLSYGTACTVTETTTGADSVTAYVGDEVVASVQGSDSEATADAGTINQDTQVRFVNSYRGYFPIDEEIVPDYTDRSTWVKEEAVNEYNAIEIEMSTTLPVITAYDLQNGSFTMNFHEVLDHELVLDEADTDFQVYIAGLKVDHSYYEVTISPDDGCSFHVDVDLTALYNDGVITEEDLQGNTEIIIFFFADLEGTGLNGSYKSTVWYEIFDKDYDEEEPLYTSNVDVVDVYTYEIDIVKYDASALNGEDYDGAALAGATLGVYYDEECTDPVIRNGDPYTEISGDDGKIIFYGLADGTYYVKEIEAPDGYVLSDEVLTVTLGEDLNDSGYTYYSEYANTPEEPGPGPEPETTDITVTKVWQDDDDAAGSRPSSVVIELLKNGESTDQYIVIGPEDNWTGSFTDLDVYTDGVENVYTVSERKVEGYTASITGDASTGFTVTNTYEPDTVLEPGPETNPPTDGNPDNINPTSGGKTGDNNMYYLWVVLMAAAAALIVVVVVMRTRRVKTRR